MLTCFRNRIRVCFRVHVLKAALFVLGFSSGAQAGEALPAPELIAPPLLPSAESFETPKPPSLLKNMARIMPDVAYWRRGGKARALNSPRALARMEETAFDGLDLVLLWPVRGKISSGFGWRGSGKRRALHEGIDIPVPKGTPVQAALSGVVSEARVYNGYGKTVILDHGDGTKTLYAHCSKIAVKRGDYVEAGQVIAYAGSTGRSTTSHLHFGVIVAGVFRDPSVLLKAESLRLVRKP
ncbi:MAG: M23 family metallopeptidase [Synergistaceae bacterium]|jgi:murein DD-endopeptidase MepM/ murein hydrolase activator NlpD|nr:M23 family metallopeptidase [Synergistaceae bacterium]